MPRADSRFWSDWTARDFSHLQHSGATTRAVPVQPEQHGPHLPVSVDATLLDGVVTACLSHPPADLIAPFLPTQVVGKSNEHTRCAGTLTLSADTLRRVWMELGACVARELLVVSNNRSDALWQLAQMTARCWAAVLARSPGRCKTSAPGALQPMRRWLPLRRAARCWTTQAASLPRCCRRWAAFRVTR